MCLRPFGAPILRWVHQGLAKIVMFADAMPGHA